MQRRLALVQGLEDVRLLHADEAGLLGKEEQAGLLAALELVEQKSRVSTRVEREGPRNMGEAELEKTLRSHYLRHLTEEAGARSVLERTRCEASRKALEELAVELGVSLAEVHPSPPVPMPDTFLRLEVLGVRLTCDCGFSGAVRLPPEALVQGIFGVKCNSCKRVQCVTVVESHERNPATFEPGHFVSLMLSLAPPEVSTHEGGGPRPAA